MTSKPSAPDRKNDEKPGPAHGLRGTDQRQGDLRDVQGGTFDRPAGVPGKDPLPRGLEHREGPLNRTSGRAPPKAEPKA
jgi:hypothetical protein